MADVKETITFFPERPEQVPPPPEPNIAMDEALAETFPASDPVALVQPRPESEADAAQSVTATTREQAACQHPDGQAADEAPEKTGAAD